MALTSLDAAPPRWMKLLAALSLGPGLVALTVLTQGQAMTALDWLIAVIFGCMAFGVIEGRRLGASTAWKIRGVVARSPR